MPDTPEKPLKRMLRAALPWISAVGWGGAAAGLLEAGRCLGAAEATMGWKLVSGLFAWGLWGVLATVLVLPWALGWTLGKRPQITWPSGLSWGLSISVLVGLSAWLGLRIDDVLEVVVAPETQRLLRGPLLLLVCAVLGTLIMRQVRKTVRVEAMRAAGREHELAETGTSKAAAAAAAPYKTPSTLYDARSKRWTAGSKA